MKTFRLTRTVIAATFLAALSTSLSAKVLIRQQGVEDPLASGFFINGCCGSGASGAPIQSDRGKPTWSVGGGDLPDQFWYNQPLTASQTKRVTKTGFVLTMIARLPGAGFRFSPETPVTLGNSDLDTTTVRWEMDLGIDADGDPVVVLPDTVDNMGPSGTAQSHGAYYILIGRRNSYNKYQLIVAFGKGTLFVNGIQVLTGYLGDTSFVGDQGVVFGVNSGGTINFNLLSLSSPAD